MPSDAPGVTTDDQDPLHNGVSDQSSARAGGAPPEPSPAASADTPSSNGVPSPTPGGAGPEGGAPPATSVGAQAGAFLAGSSSAGRGPSDWPDPAGDPAGSPDPAPSPEPAPTSTREPDSSSSDPGSWSTPPLSSSPDLGAGSTRALGDVPDPLAPSIGSTIPASTSAGDAEAGLPVVGAVDDTARSSTDPSLDASPMGLAGGEPPPAPVLTPGGPEGRTRERRGRHASPRTDRASKRGLRVNQRLWSIDPWSVFKVSVLFYLCVGLIVLVAGTLLYNAGRSVGTIDQVESFVTRMGAYGECVATAEVAEGVEFEEDDETCGEGEVLVGGFTLDDGILFRAAAIGGTVLVVAGSIGNVLLTVLLNLLNELTGGLRHTVVKEPVARQQGGGGPRAPSRMGRLPVGSPRRQPPG